MRGQHSKGDHRFVTSRARWALLTAVAAVPVVGGSTAWGIVNRFDYYTGTGEQDWFNPAGWSDGTPAAEDNARVISSGTLDLSGSAAVSSLVFGYGPNVTPTLNLNAGGSLTSAGDVIFAGDGSVANGTGVSATLNQNGGNIVIPANHILWMGDGGSTTWNMSAGTVTVGYPARSSLTNLGIAIGTGVSDGVTTLTPTSTLNLSGGTINSDAVFELARNGATGVLNMTGGTINAGDEIWIGQPGTTGGQATITQSGGTINTGFNQYGVNSYSSVFVGMGNAGKAANYTLSGTGALNVYQHLYVGGGPSTVGGVTGGEGNFTMNGGTVSIGDARQVSGSSLYIGWSRGAAASVGNVTLNSGTMTLNLPNSAIVVGSYDANAGTLPAGQAATLNVAGATVNASKSLLEIGRNGANGTLNLSAGQLTINSLQWLNPSGSTTTRQFNFTGGTLNANSANTDYAITNAGGTFRPGGTATKLFTTTGGDGSYVQNSGSVSLDLASNADYDALDLSAGGVGAANLSGGSVNVTATGGYAPTFGAAFPAITAKSIGDSATWSLPTLGAGNTWDRRLATDGSGNQVESLAVVRSSASTLSSGSSWTTATWSAGTPNAADASAKLAGAGGTVSVDSPVTVGYLQLDGTGSWTVGGSSTLTIATSGGATGGIMAFGGAHTISAPIAFNSNAAIGTQLKSTSVTLSGNISGSAAVEKTGPGSLALTSTGSTFTGTWGVSGGSLNIDSDANLGAAGASLAVSNATVNVSGAWNSARAIALSSTGATLNLGSDSSLSGVISGAGGITKADANVLVLSGANTYSGKTTVNAGTLRQGAPNAVPSASAVTLATGTTLDLAGNAASIGSLAGAGNVTTGGANLSVGNDNTTTSYSGLVSGGGTFTKTGTGTLTFNRPASAGAADDVVPIDGNIVVAGGTLAFNGLNRSTYDLPFNDITINAGANLSLNSSGAAGPNGGAFFNSIHGAGQLTIGPTFLITLSGPNDYTGGTVITGGAVAAITDMSALGASGTPIHAVGTGTRDNLSFNGGIWFQIGDGVTPSAGTFDHPLTVDGYKLTSLNAFGNDITLTQPITGGGSMVFQGSGGGTFRLNAVNTYKGVTQIDSTLTIVLGVDNALPTGGIAESGTLDLNGHAQTLGYLVSGGTPKIHLNGANLTIDSDVDPTFGGGWTGSMDGTGALIKTGGQSQLFTLATGQANTYTGGTTIHQGTLQIANNINGLPAGKPVQIDAGGELQFSPTAAASSLPAGSTIDFAGAISGAGEVQIASTEPVSLSGNNTYTGGTRISNGFLVVNADSNLGAPSGPITYHWNGSNPGPILQFGADVTSARNVVIENSPAFVDTNGHNATLGNVDGNMNPLTGGPGNFSKVFGGGTLTVNHVRVNALTVNAGTLAIATNAGTNSVSNVRSLSVGAGALVDLKNNNMVVGGGATGSWDGTAYTGVTGYVQSGRGDGTWNGTTGVKTSVAGAADYTSLGVASAADVKGLSGTATDTWAGQTVHAGDTLVMYTYGGDANLDGVINIDDYTQIDSSVSVGGSLKGWFNGDFNYDGNVDIDDYTIIDSNIGIQGAPFPTAAGISHSAGTLSGVTAVPEPASLGLIAAGALLMRRRRRKN